MIGSKWIAFVALVGAVVGFTATVDQANAQVVTCYSGPPTTVYYSAPVQVVRPVRAVYRPAVVYAPTTTYYAPAPRVAYYAPAPRVAYYAPAPTTTFYAPAPAPVVYQPPQRTVLYHRGPLGILPRRTVLYSPGYVAPAPIAFPTVGAVYP